MSIEYEQLRSLLDTLQKALVDTTGDKNNFGKIQEVKDTISRSIYNLKDISHILDKIEKLLRTSSTSKPQPVGTGGGQNQQTILQSSLKEAKDVKAILEKHLPKMMAADDKSLDKLETLIELTGITNDELAKINQLDDKEFKNSAKEIALANLLNQHIVGLSKKFDEANKTDNCCDDIVKRLDLMLNKMDTGKSGGGAGSTAKINDHRAISDNKSGGDQAAGIMKSFGEATQKTTGYLNGFGNTISASERKTSGAFADFNRQMQDRANLEHSLLGQAAQGFMGLHDTLHNSRGAFSTMGTMFGSLAIKGVAVDELFHLIGERAEQFHKLGDAGQTFENDMYEMSRQINAAGYSAETFGNMMTGAGSQALRALGSKDFLKLGPAVRDHMKSLGNLGMSFGQTNATLIEYMDIQKSFGELWNTTAESINAGFTTMIQSSTALSKAMGINREDFIKEQKSRVKEKDFRLRTMGMSAESKARVGRAGAMGAAIDPNVGKVMELLAMGKQRGMAAMDKMPPEIKAAIQMLSPEAWDQSEKSNAKLRSLQGEKQKAETSGDTEGAKKLQEQITEEEIRANFDRVDAIKAAGDRVSGQVGPAGEDGGPSLGVYGEFQGALGDMRTNIATALPDDPVKREKMIQDAIAASRNQQNLSPGTAAISTGGNTLDQAKAVAEGAKSPVLKAATDAFAMLKPAIDGVIGALNSFTSSKAFLEIGSQIVFWGTALFMGYKAFKTLLALLKHLSVAIESLTKKINHVPTHGPTGMAGGKGTMGGYGKPTLAEEPKGMAKMLGMGGTPAAPTGHLPPGGAFGKALESQNAPKTLMGSLKGGAGKILGGAKGMLGSLPKLIGTAAGPIGLLVAAGQALAGGISGFKHADEILDKSKDKLNFGDKLAAGVGGAVGGIVSTLDDITGMFGLETNIGGWATKHIGKTIASVFDGVSGFVGEIGDVLGGPSAPKAGQPASMAMGQMGPPAGEKGGPGALQKFALGGWVQGSGTGDSVLASLTPGEFVMPPDQAKKYASSLEGMRSGKTEPGDTGGSGTMTLKESSSVTRSLGDLSGMNPDERSKAIQDRLAQYKQDHAPFEEARAESRAMFDGGRQSIGVGTPVTLGERRGIGTGSEFMGPVMGRPNAELATAMPQRQSPVGMTAKATKMLSSPAASTMAKDGVGVEKAAADFIRSGGQGFIKGTQNLLKSAKTAFINAKTAVKSLPIVTSTMQSMENAGKTISNFVKTGDATKAAADMGKAFEGIGNKLSTVSGTLEKQAGELIGKAEAKLPGAMEQMSKVYETAGSKLSSISGEVSKHAAEMVSKAESKLPSVMERMSQTYETVGSRLSKVSGEVSKHATELMTKNFSGISSEVSGLGGKLSKAFAEPIKVTTEGLVKSFENASGRMSELGSKISAKGPELIGKVQSMVPSTTQISEAYGKASSMVAEAGPKVMASASELGAKAMSMMPSAAQMSEGFGKASEAASGIGKQIMSKGGEMAGKIGGMLPSMGSITEAGGKIAGTFAKVSGPLEAGAAKVAASIGLKAIPGIGEIVMAGQAVMDGIDGFNHAGEILKKNEKDLDFGDKVSAGVGAAAGGLVGIVDGITGLFGYDTSIGKDTTALIAKGLAGTKDAVVGLATGVVDTVSSVTSAVAGGIGSVVSGVGGFIGGLFGGGDDKKAPAQSDEVAGNLMSASKMFMDSAFLLKDTIGKLSGGGEPQGMNFDDMAAAFGRIMPTQDSLESFLSNSSSSKETFDIGSLIPDITSMFTGLMPDFSSLMPSGKPQDESADKFGSIISKIEPLAPAMTGGGMSSPLDKQDKLVSMKMPEKDGDDDMNTTLEQLLVNQEKLTKLFEKYLSGFNLYVNDWHDHVDTVEELTQNISRFSERTHSSIRKLQETV